MSEPSIVPHQPFTPPVSTVADGVAYPLDPRYVPLRRRVALIGVAIRTLFVAGGVFFVVSVAELPAEYHRWVYAAAGALVLAMVGWSQWWPAISYRYASYRVDAQG